MLDGVPVGSCVATTSHCQSLSGREGIQTKTCTFCSVLPRRCVVESNERSVVRTAPVLCNGRRVISHRTWSRCCRATGSEADDCYGGGKRVYHFLFVLSDGKSTLHLISTCMCTHVRNANHPPFALDLSLFPFNHLPLTFDGATNPRLRVDMGWADASWHREVGYKEVSTPKMEALAKVGPPTALSVLSVRQHAASLPKLPSFMLHAALIYADVRTIHRDVVGGDRARSALRFQILLAIAISGANRAESHPRQRQ